ncbi:DNA-processing protein DprA [Streptosporangium vulgare]|uniref:DNA-processing protein DprA n=1 Tax=Streptosporangium vulgare TaxID=46190 RepID=A0ABV5T469_9ACTN
MVMTMTIAPADEQAAVLALTKTTCTQPGHHTARIIAAAGSALKLIAGDDVGLDETDRAHAADLRSHVSVEDLDQARDLITTMRAVGVSLVTVLDDTYPGNMLWANNHQPFLWVRGQMLPEDHRAVAVVGERDSDRAVAAAHALAEAGLTVAAPLRTALDAAVHEAALAAGGRTLGVLTGGMAAPDVLGPYANVARQIGERAALVSPFWPDTAPTDQTIAQEHMVTCGLAATVYITDGGDGGSSHRCTEMVLKTGKHVFVPQRLHQEHAWVAQAGFRGGITVVQDTDDLSKQAVNLVDMCSQTTMF